MARTIEQILASIIASKAADSVLSGLTSTSSEAVWRKWSYITALSEHDLEENFDDHKNEVKGIIKTEKAHTTQWYVTKAKAFQYGDTLAQDSDVYDPIAPAGDASLIVAFAAAVELPNLIRIKTAKGTVGALVPLSGGELTAFSQYIFRIHDAGVRIICTSAVGDTFQPEMKIHYDPLVLDGSGARLDGTAPSPIKDAVNIFLNSLPFNGKLRFDEFIAAMEAVEGVVIAEVVGLQAFYGVVPPIAITVEYTPDAGYLVLDNLYFSGHVTYVPYTS